MSCKKNKQQIPNAISNLVIPYLDKYKDQIVGIYLSPYKLGDKTKIEVDIISKQSNKIKIDENLNKATNNLTIYVKINDYDDYKKSQITCLRKKLDKDLKGGYIIYDPEGILKSKQKRLKKQDSVIPFINSSELEESVIQITRNNLALVKKN